MQIFVTGATGFIGSHFVECALAAGHTVVGLYRSESARHKAIADRLRHLGATLHRGDLLEPATFARHLEGADCVCHFAAAFREAEADEVFFERINVRGTINVLQAAVRAKVRRFVHCSTAGIHGQRSSELIDEHAPLDPWNVYERSKAAAEQQLVTLAAEAGMEYVILRPTAVYGPGDERLAKLFRSVAKGRFPLFGSGQGCRHMVYVTDLADAFLRACTVPGAANQAFIIAGPEAVPLRQMLRMLAHAAARKSFGPRLPLKPMLWLAGVIEDLCSRVGISPPIYRRRMDFYLNDAVFSWHRARTVLGWTPKVGLQEGFAMTMRAMLASSEWESSAATNDADSKRLPSRSRPAARDVVAVTLSIMSGALSAAVFDAV